MIDTSIHWGVVAELDRGMGHDERGAMKHKFPTVQNDMMVMISFANYLIGSYSSYKSIRQWWLQG